MTIKSVNHFINRVCIIKMYVIVNQHICEIVAISASPTLPSAFRGMPKRPDREERGLPKKVKHKSRRDVLVEKKPKKMRNKIDSHRKASRCHTVLSKFVDRAERGIVGTSLSVAPTQNRYEDKEGMNGNVM